MPKGIKNIKTVQKEIEKKLTSQELITVGAFSQRLGQVLAGLEAEKRLAEDVLMEAQDKHKRTVVAIDEKLELIKSDPVKYFRTLDTQFELLGGNSPTSPKASGEVSNNPNLTSDMFTKLIGELSNISANTRGIGDMIYEHNRNDRRPDRYFR